MGFPRLISHDLLWFRISLYFLPSKIEQPNIRQWKMIPAEKTSLMGSLFVVMSLMLMISGATNPGVPQRTKRQFCQSALVASPKSQMARSQELSFRNMMFSGLRSRWMILCCARWLSPRSKLWIISRTYVAVGCLPLFSISFSWLPWRYYRMTQMEFQVSQTPSSFMRLGWVILRMSFISFSSDCLPLSPAYCFYLEKALTATIWWSLSLSARQTVAKAPLPIFRLALNSLWKFLWLIFFSRERVHSSAMVGWAAWNVSCYWQCYLYSLIAMGVPMESVASWGWQMTSNFSQKSSGQKWVGVLGLQVSKRRMQLSVRASWTSRLLAVKWCLRCGRASSSTRVVIPEWSC